MALKTVTVLVVLYKLLTHNLEVSIAASNKVKPKGAAILLLLYFISFRSSEVYFRIDEWKMAMNINIASYSIFTLS